ncbi:MAG: hypothetical protein M3Y72_17985 [Acidobacteriota bacterium]|nr:hypothetical protein [Acidobacteriota bacterium]
MKNIHASIQNAPYMRLVIEDIGVGSRGHQAISVAHYFTQNGDLCQGPELCFELVPEGGHVAYEPFLFQQAIPPVYQEVFENGPASENHRLKRKLTEFAQMWDRNLQEQGSFRYRRRNNKPALRRRPGGHGRSSLNEIVGGRQASCSSHRRNRKR